MTLASSGGLLTSMVAAGAADEIQPPAGFTSLFNGKDFDGWHGRPTLDTRKWESTPEEKKTQWNNEIKEHWKVDGDTIVNDGKGAYLTTNEEFGDIELLVEYKTVPKADSGIYLRGTPQVQIWDSTNEKEFKNGSDKGSGGLWNNSPGAPGKDPLVLADKPFGEWNKFRIIQVGARTSVWLNDKLVVDKAIMENYFDRKLPLFAKGVIQLQTHGNEIQWRNIFVRKIEAEEANKFLAEGAGDGFKQLFDGKSLDGWAGEVDNYQVVDGAIQCKTGRGGVLHTEDQYQDFVVRLEFKLPPGGNNGLAIRYPGKGDTAYTGMCELQVLDTEHPKYAKLDPRQAHGSAYGMAAATRGYLRPAGQWNYQVVTVKGSTIRVELNGSPILDTDLSKVTDYMDGKAHPGKDRTEGYFGFAGHNDPVQFRNVSIKRL
ncbi:MAG: 3-keto-disaccharide hydrolase [Aureliella sp.]